LAFARFDVDLISRRWVACDVVNGRVEDPRMVREKRARAARFEDDTTGG
jgi:hypothetical protein